MEVLGDFFGGLWESLTADWRPAVEIVIFAAVFYALFRSLRLVRVTGALRMIAVVAVIILALTVIGSHAAGLVRLQWMLEKFAILFAIGTIVLFQPELRRAFSRAARGPLAWRIFRSETNILEEVLKAAEILSGDRSGALIAFQREDSLASYIKGGVLLNAEVSAELLVSIFNRGSPLRDGAVVLRGGKVAAAGCLFPLTENVQFAKTLGTRHRAAVGLTERTDAVVVAVSGESGKLSVGMRGELMQGVSMQDLRGILNKLCPELAAGGQGGMS